MSKHLANDKIEANTVSVTLPGTVEKIIPSAHPDLPEKAQISIESADSLYREVRVENVVEDANGEEASLKVGAEVEVTIEAAASATKPKS
jgi:hypothetical protein